MIEFRPLRRVALAASVAVALVELAGCASDSLSRLGYETLQQRECSAQTGLACPAEAGGYDAYRAARKQETGQ